MWVFFILLILKSVYAAAKWRASTADGSAATDLWEFGSLNGGRVVVSPVLMSLYVRMTVEMKPSGVLVYRIVLDWYPK